MANVTLAIPNELLEKARKYAQERGTLLNALIRKLLEEVVEYNREKREELLKLIQEISEKYKGKLDKFRREDFYERL